MAQLCNVRMSCVQVGPQESQFRELTLTPMKANFFDLRRDIERQCLDHRQ